MMHPVSEWKEGEEEGRGIWWKWEGNGERKRGVGEWRRVMPHGDGSETGSATKIKSKMGKKIDDRYRCQPHSGFQG